MGRKKLTKSEKIRRYVAANPNASSGDVAKALDVSPVLVYTVKYNDNKKQGAQDKQETKPTAPVVPTVKVEEKPALDMVNHPPHYMDGGIETIDFIRAKLTKEEFIGYLKGSAIKYSSRIGKKGPAEMDAGKLAWYATALRNVVSL